MDYFVNSEFLSKAYLSPFRIPSPNHFFFFSVKAAWTSLYLSFVWHRCLNSVAVQAQIVDWNEVGPKNSPFVAHILSLTPR